jgi:hypothetical protein
MNRKRRAKRGEPARWRLGRLRPFLASVVSIFVLGGCVRTRIVERRQPSVMYEQFGVLARAHLVAPPGERLGGEVTVEHKAPGARLEVLIDVWNGHPGVYAVHLIPGSSCSDLLSRKAQPLSEAYAEETGVAFEESEDVGTPIANLMMSANGRGHLEASVAPYFGTEQNTRTLLHMSVFISRIDPSGSLPDRIGCAELTATTPRSPRT